MKKRLLSWLVVLALMCGSLPASVLAEDVKTEPSVPVAGETQAAREQETGPAEAKNEPEQTGPEEPEESEELKEAEEPQESQPAEEVGAEAPAAPEEPAAAVPAVQAAGNAEQPIAPYAAQIEEVVYDTLDEAVAAVTGEETIKLLNDCQLTVSTIGKNVTINSNGKTVTVSGGLQLLSGGNLTFQGGQVLFCADKEWNVVIGAGDAPVSKASLTFTDGCQAAFTGGGLYSSAGAVIRVSDRAALTFEDTGYTAVMGVKPSNSSIEWATIQVENGSRFEIDHAWRPAGSDKDEANGITCFKINVTESSFAVTNCENQGLVRCWLTLDKAAAEISGNDTGMTGYNGTDVLTMKNGSRLTMEDNRRAGILLWGGHVEVQSGNTLAITGTGKAFSGAPDRYTGAFVCYYYRSSYQADVRFEDGADVKITGNPLGGINNDGKLYLGTGTEITGNGGKALYGGGIQNRGDIEIADGVKLYNNHAETAGDDLYNTTGESQDKEPVTYTGTVAFGAVGSGWVLDDCGHGIDGWYYDEAEDRWSAHEKPLRTDAYSAGGETVEGTLALKAAHGLIPVEPDEPDAPFHSKSKTATNLDKNYQSEVTLSLPAKEEPLTSDVVFVLDKSTSAALEEQALAMLKDLQEQIRLVGGKVKVGVVSFNKEAHATGLLDLETQYADIEAAVKQELKSGTNTHAGLLAGKALLDEDTAVDASRKYLAFVSDGITYMYGAEPTATAWTFDADGFKNWAGPDNWASKYGTSEPPEDWNAWLADIGEKVAKQGTDYEYPYGGTVENATPKENWQTAYATSIDKALHLTHEAYQDARSAGYHCYAMTATQNEGTQHIWGPAFMNYLAGGEEVSFAGIGHDILYLLSAGSRVEDHLGYMGDYNFDLVLPEGQCPFAVTATGADGTKTIYTARADGENTWKFFSDGQDGPAFTVTYHPGEKKGDEYFTWTFHQSVTNFQRVELTYTVKLTDPKTASGTYGKFDADGSQKYDGLYTNNSATLYPVDSNNDSGLPESFGKPTVSYTVSGGSSGGGGEKLNTEDHYSYIIGYKDGYLRPYGNISRGEVATIFFRMLTDQTRNDYWSQTNPYADVAAEKWCNNAISTLHRMNIIDGYANGTFQPDGPITRAAFTKMAVNFFDYHVKAYDGKFSDVDGDAWYAGYIQAAAELKLIEGFADGTFRPDDYITRAQACTIINRTLGRVPQGDHMNIKPLVTWPDCDADDWYYTAMMEATNSHDYKWITVNKEKTEEWTAKLPQRDWAALEHTWSTANSAKGGEVVG